MGEIGVNTLSEIIGNKIYHKRIKDLGERVWIAEGEECDIIYWDASNGMCRILQMLPKVDDGCKAMIMKYLKLILEAAENE